ncbi:MAG: extracellular solute-binding protein [Anaerolineae bacterium]|jgi:arabinogalactan oligomer/maltooligosaccharide transport system substrate-binding protein
MKKSLFSLLALLLVLSLVISACGPTPEPTEAPQVEPTQEEAAPEPTQEEAAPEPTQEEAPAEPSLAGTITLWHGWKESEIPALNDVIQAFQGMYPDVQFDVLYVPHEDLQGKYETAAATGGGPSVLIGSADWGPSWYDAELVADISAMTTEEFLRTINPAALGAVRYRDALIGLPQTIKGVVMFRNTSIIPDAPATFDDLVTAAQAATTGDVVGADLEYGFFFSAAHLNGLGGLLMDENGNPLFNDEKGVEWVNLINSFQDAGPVENNNDNDVNLFKAGQAGIIIDGTWNMSGLADAIGADNLSVDPWPTPLSGYVQTENIYLSANAEGGDKDAAWAFMEFFLSSEAQAILTEAGHIPAVTGVEVTDPLMEQAATAFEGGTAFPVIPEMGCYWDPGNNALLSVVNEGADPAAVLQQAYNTITACIADQRGEAPPEEEVMGTITLWHGWKESEIPGLNNVIAAFQEKHPDVQFDVLYVPHEDLQGKYETAAATGGGPTVLIGSADWGPGWYDAELVADVRAFTNTPFLASINEAALGAVEYEGALIGLPQTIKGVVMFRNTSIIPDAPATYDDLVAAAQAATAGDIVGADLEYGFFFSSAHLNGIGGQLMDSDGNPLFNDEKGVEWVNLINSFKDAGPVENNNDNDVNLFKAGNAGIIIDGTWNMSGFVETLGADNLAVDPWPAYGEEEGAHLSGYVQTENIYLSANAEGDDQMAGWKFMEFFLSPEAQAMLADIGHIPAIAGVEVTDPLMLQAVEAFAAGTAFPVIPEMGCYWDPGNNALLSAVEEGTDPAEALQQAYDTITACIADQRGE